MGPGDEKPMHVRVAEALGWTRSKSVGVATDGASWWSPIAPRYDLDWSATGPLIERYDVHLQPETRVRWAALAWREEWGAEYIGEGEGPTPLLAVCNLILSLHAAGKLAKVAA